MSGWTPGPWFAHGPINANRRDHGVVAGRPYDPSVGAQRRIAWVGNASQIARSEGIESELEANARQIAAAPQLYAEGEQSAITLDEAANLLHGVGLHGSASLMAIQAAKQRAALALANSDTGDAS